MLSFVRQCHTPAKKLLNEMLNNKYGENVTNAIKRTMKTMEDQLVYQTGSHDRGKHQQYLLNNYDSPLIKGLFYNSPTPLSLIPEVKAMIPLTASSPVPGINGYENNGSIQQGNATPPSCQEWWEGGGQGLKFRMANAMKKSLATKVGHDLNVPECQNDYPFYMSDRRKEVCVNKVTEDLYQGKGDNLTAELFRVIQGEGKTDSVLSDSEAGKLGGLALAGVGSSIASMITGKDLSIGIIGQATSLYMTLFILKLMLKYFIPMILMAVYMFWGPFMVVSEFRGMSMIKGMILIIALTMMPSLWAIVDHLDDTLYSAMYSGTDSDDMLKFNMLLLDITTGIFQIGIVFVLFYLIGEAGGGNARGAVNDTQGFGETGARGAGNTIGKGAGKGTQWATVGSRGKGGITSGGWGSKGLGYGKGFIGKFKK